MVGYIPFSTYVVKIGDAYFWDTDDEAVRAFMTQASAECYIKLYQHPESMRVVQEPLVVTMAAVKGMGDVRLIFSHCHAERGVTDAELLYDPDETIH